MDKDFTKALLTTSPVIAAAVVSIIFVVGTVINPSTEVTGVIPTTTTPSPTQTSDPPSVTITAESLYTAFLASSEAFDAQYINKIIIVQGVLSEVSPSSSLTKWVRLKTSTGSALVQCQLSTELTFVDSISMLIGKTITISGVCKGTSGNYVIINNISSDDLPIIAKITGG